MKKYVLIIGLVAVAAGGIGFYFYNKPHQNIGRAKADFKMTAPALFSTFEADEAAANEKYLGKIIEVSGTVQDVKKEEDGLTSITLESEDLVFGVICQLDGQSIPKRTVFNPGEQVTFKGICTGLLMDVVLVRCVEL